MEIDYNTPLEDVIKFLLRRYTINEIKATVKAINKTLLPSVPSKLIEIALNDLEAMEKTPGVQIDMRSWHDADAGGCSVCMAGAVMAKRLGAERDITYYPRDFPGDTRQLNAINLLRVGDVENACYTLKIKNPNDFPDREIIDYELSPTLFKEQMRSFARDLRVAGL